MTRVFYAATLYDAMTLAAALDTGRFGDHTQRRLLIVSHNAPIPELAPGFDESPAFATLRDRFDDVVRWNDLIAPMHPVHWLPSNEELPMLSRLFTERLGLTGGVTELVVESIAVAPAATIASLLRDCPITVYAEGLMSYGPTQATPRPGIGRRIERLLYPDLVAGVPPLLLCEYKVEPVVLPASAFTDVVAALPVPEVGSNAGCPVVVGQHLAQLGVLAEADETDLYLRMLQALAARGDRRVVFLPHPAARTHTAPLQAEAAALGVELVVPSDAPPAEAWCAAGRPSLVVSCFSTAVLTARRYGLEVATLGADVVLERLAPYENSNRIPATIVDATVPRLHDDGTVAAPPEVDVARLVSAVGYCMQADRLPELRPAAVSHLAEHGPARYFKKRRLETLGLVAAPTVSAPPTSPRAPATVGRVARRLLAEARTAADKRRSSG